MDQQQLYDNDEDDYQARSQPQSVEVGVRADENGQVENGGLFYDASRRSSFVSIPSMVSTVVSGDGAYHSVDFGDSNGSILHDDNNERRNLLGDAQVTYRQQRQPRTLCYRFIHIIDIFLSIVLFSPIVSIFW